jgi:hypothetical protein
MPRTKYFSATRETERYKAGEGGTNKTPNTHFEHPWEEGQQHNVRKPEVFTPVLNGCSSYAVEKIRDEVVGLFRDKLSVSVSATGQSYWKPYSHRFDVVPYPQGTRIPDFYKFSGEGGKSTHEHISQFLAHLGELDDREDYRVCLFSLSPTGTAFTWEELEHKFHEHFFS